VCYENILDIAK